MASGAVELTASWWKCRAKGVLKDSWKWWDGESEVRNGVGRNEIVGRLIERVVKRFAGTCIARRDIVNPSIPDQVGFARRERGEIKRDRPHQSLSHPIHVRGRSCGTNLLRSLWF